MMRLKLRQGKCVSYMSMPANLDTYQCDPKDASACYISGWNTPRELHQSRYAFETIQDAAKLVEDMIECEAAGVIIYDVDKRIDELKLKRKWSLEHLKIERDWI